MKRKSLALLLSVSMLTAALSAGITVGAEEATTEEEAAAENVESSGDVIELEFVNQKREAADTFQAIVDQFNEENPDVHVTLNTTPDGSGVLMTRASSDSLPEILMHWPTDSQYIQFRNEGLLADLQDKDYLDNIVDSYVEDMRSDDGGIYAVPLALSFMGVFYNADMFDAAGYEIPETWDELTALCDDIVANGEVPFLLCNKDSWTVSQLWMNIESKDRGSYVDFYKELDDGTASWNTDDIAIDSMNKMISITEEYSQGDTLSLGYDQAINDFANGGSYMFIQGSWALPSIEAANPDANIQMFSMPNDNGDMQELLAIDCAICVSAAAEADPEKSEAVDRFMSYLFSTESAQAYSDMDHSPSAVKGVVPDLPKETLILETIDKTGYLDLSIAPVGWEDSKREEIQNVFMGESTEDFLTWLNDEWIACREAEE